MSSVRRRSRVAESSITARVDTGSCTGTETASRTTVDTASRTGTATASHTKANNRLPSYHHTFQSTGDTTPSPQKAFQPAAERCASPQKAARGGGGGIHHHGEPGKSLRKWSSRENMAGEKESGSRPGSGRERGRGAAGSSGGRHARSRSIGAGSGRTLSQTMPAGDLKAMIGKRDTLMISRDGAGRHSVDSGDDNSGGGGGGGGKRLTNARMNISPKRILPDKPKAITRSATVASFNLGGLYEEGRPALTKSVSVEDPTGGRVSGRTSSRTSRSASVSSAYDDYSDGLTPHENMALNEKMERLFEEYRRQEQGEPPPGSRQGHRVGVSRLLERTAGCRQRPSIAGAGPGRTAAGGEPRGSGVSRPTSAKERGGEGLARGRQWDGRRSPANTPRRARSNSGASLLDEPSGARPAGRPAGSRPTTPVHGRATRQGGSREDLVDTPAGRPSSSRPTTPVHGRGTRGYQGGSREDLVDTPAGRPGGSRPTTPSHGRGIRRYQGGSREDLVDTPAGRPGGSRPTTPVHGRATRGYQGGGSREDLVDTPASRCSRPTTPVRGKSGYTSREDPARPRTPSRGRPAGRHASGEDLLDDSTPRPRTPARDHAAGGWARHEDLTDPYGEDRHREAAHAEVLRARPRKEKRDNSRTRIPLPVGTRAPHSAEQGLKRYDSGVDINNMSPTDSSVQGEDEPYLYGEPLNVDDHSLSYDDDKRRKQDYF